MPLIAVEVVLGFVVPVGWGVWELMSLRRERRRDAEKVARATTGTIDAAPPPLSVSQPDPARDAGRSEAGPSR